MAKTKRIGLCLFFNSLPPHADIFGPFVANTFVLAPAHEAPGKNSTASCASIGSFPFGSHGTGVGATVAATDAAAAVVANCTRGI